MVTLIRCRYRSYLAWAWGVEDWVLGVQTVLVAPLVAVAAPVVPV